MAKIGSIKPASGQSQAIPVRGSKSGGSQPTPQASPPSVKGLKQSSKPGNPQRIRG